MQTSVYPRCTCYCHRSPERSISRPVVGTITSLGRLQSANTIISFGLVRQLSMYCAAVSLQRTYIRLDVRYSISIVATRPPSSPTFSLQTMPYKANAYKTLLLDLLQPPPRFLSSVSALLKDRNQSKLNSGKSLSLFTETTKQTYEECHITENRKW